MSATTPALKCSCGANINMLVNLKVVNEICKKMLSSKAITNRGETAIHKTFHFSTRLIHVSNVLSSWSNIYFCKDIFMLLTSFSGNVFVLRSSYVKNSTRRWVTLSQSVRRETNFSKNRIWPQPTRYVFILEISAKKSLKVLFTSNLFEADFCSCSTGIWAALKNS